MATCGTLAVAHRLLLWHKLRCPAACGISVPSQGCLARRILSQWTPREVSLVWFYLVSFSFSGKTTVFFQQKAHNVGFPPCCDVSHHRESFVLVSEDKGKFVEDMRSRRAFQAQVEMKSAWPVWDSARWSRVRPRQGGRGEAQQGSSDVPEPGPYVDGWWRRQMATDAIPPQEKRKWLLVRSVLLS